MDFIFERFATGPPGSEKKQLPGQLYQKGEIPRNMAACNVRLLTEVWSTGLRKIAKHGGHIARHFDE
jgi:hypothetical protein